MNPAVLHDRRSRTKTTILKNQRNHTLQQNWKMQANRPHLWKKLLRLGRKVQIIYGKSGTAKLTVTIQTGKGEMAKMESGNLEMIPV